jgi:branched-chain amino acid transport system ATP-binding protein
VNLLELNDVSKSFGGVCAISNVSFCLEEGGIYGLIGPNGAGKTTLFNCITGCYHPNKGSILFAGQDITRKPIHSIFRMGISRTFQLVKVFLEMTVLENVMVSAFCKTNSIKTAVEMTSEILEFVGLSDFRNVRASNLTLVNKKILDLSSALVSKPRLLMIDEVFAGLTPKEVEYAVELVHKIQKREITILLIEHVMEVVMPLCARVSVLDNGVKVAEGRPEAITKDEAVINAYLGSRYRAKGK